MQTLIGICRSGAAVLLVFQLAAPGNALTVQGPAPGPSKFELKDGTPIKLKLNRTITSEFTKPGESVEYVVTDEILIGTKIVIPEGAIAVGKVMMAEQRRHMSRGGKLDISVDSIKLINGQIVKLRALKEARGGGRGLDMTGGILWASALTLGVGAPFVLLLRGKDIVVPKGIAVTAFVDGDTSLEDVAFLDKSAPVAPATVQAATELKEAATIEFLVASDPDSAEIEADGIFLGSTPSKIRLSRGQHLLSIRKRGFKNWQRTIVLATDSVQVKAELEVQDK